MSRKIILIKQELLLLVYELNRSGLLAENEKIRPILAQLEKLLLCDLSPSTNDSVKNLITSILSFISGRLATKSNQIKQLIRNGRSASLQRTFKKSFTSFSHSTRNKTRD